MKRLLFLATLLAVTHSAVLAPVAWAKKKQKCPTPESELLRPGFKTAIAPLGSPDKFIFVELVGAKDRTPEGFFFHLCAGGQLSEKCPPMLESGVVIPTQEMLKGAIGALETVKAYASVFGVIGALVGLNAAIPTNYGLQGLAQPIQAFPFDRVKRAKEAHQIFKDAIHNACSSDLLRDGRIGSEPVATTMDDLLTNIQLMLFGILSHELKETVPGTEGYKNRMAVNDYVNELYKATKEKEAACAADKTKCDKPDDGGDDQ
jgi:hypothetical protein